MTIVNNMTFKIAGEAGQGVESSGAGFAKAFARGGLHIVTVQDYMSRIRGGHNFFQIRVNETPMYAHNEDRHLLLAFTAEAVEKHLPEIVPGGGVIYDERIARKVDAAAIETRRVKALPVPMAKIAQEEGGDRIMSNTAAVAAAAGLVDYPYDLIASVISDNFKRKGTETVTANLKVARYAYDYARDEYGGDFPFKLQPIEGAPRRLVVNGNQALALGALLGGCNFISAYPMTPATSIFEWLMGRGHKYGVVAKQVEDEIAAINMAIGASHAGARAMTATSGGGFSLMVEALGLAAMTETPLVVVEAQRPGPSTGLPTRTGQEDLLFLLNASQGEFPRIVLTPGTIEEAFEAGWRAFNLAERYQTPVIVITDNFLANSLRSIDESALDFDAITIDRGQLLTDMELSKLNGDYQRYAVTDSGISPRALPGHPGAVYVAAGNEHTVEGRITEDADLRNEQVEKRMRKALWAAQEIGGPVLYGPEEAEITFITWGSSYGPVRETVDALNREGEMANMLHFKELYPFPTDETTAALDKVKKPIVVEGNFTGQLQMLIQAHTGRLLPRSIRRYDGRPFSPEYILSHLQAITSASPIAASVPRVTAPELEELEIEVTIDD
jgi:2-oxoglutarate ferredoxin oxidoreductase subunit alpha